MFLLSFTIPNLSSVPLVRFGRRRIILPLLTPRCPFEVTVTGIWHSQVVLFFVKILEVGVLPNPLVTSFLLLSLDFGLPFNLFLSRDPLSNFSP